ncbi:MAG: hypothetical protein Q7T18_06600, partial [Sedimentisphaerales bacterium]|nr:hypothetical protein [Sedimentisphaerales bacterium]
ACDLSSCIGLYADVIYPSVPQLIFSGIHMKNFLPYVALLSTLVLGACDNRPIVVTPPAEPVAVPGPAGPQGATGAQGASGNQGNVGMQGNDGIQGNDGLQGNKGNQGNDGAQGFDGSKGKDGKPGAETTVIVVPPAPVSSSPR